MKTIMCCAVVLFASIAFAGGNPKDAAQAESDAMAKKGEPVQLQFCDERIVGHDVDQVPGGNCELRTVYITYSFDGITIEEDQKQ